MPTCPRYKEEGSRNRQMSWTWHQSQNESACVNSNSWQIQKFQPNEVSFTQISALPSQYFRPFIKFSCSAPVLHAKQHVLSREVARVKEFPAGNAATSASRITFLHSLCKLPKFVLLLNLVQSVVHNFLLVMVSVSLIVEDPAKAFTNAWKLPFLGIMEQLRDLLTFKIPLSGFIQEHFIHFERFSLPPISFKRGKGWRSNNTSWVVWALGAFFFSFFLHII